MEEMGRFGLFIKDYGTKGDSEAQYFAPHSHYRVNAIYRVSIVIGTDFNPCRGHKRQDMTLKAPINTWLP